ncbi:MAG: sulfite exporter TauE/SafE family protein [Leptonema sp. (in: bacteria)]
MNSLYFLGFFSGFVGGFAHCSLMCTPIISSLREKQYNFKIIQMFYHSGRIFTYSFLGAFLGYSGSFVDVIGNLFGIQNFVRIFIGVFLIFKGLELLNVFYIKKIFYIFDWLESRSFRFSKILVYFKDLDSVWKYFLYGIVLGFLPCGLSYTALITSASTLDPFRGFMYMFLFGIGNVPALWLIVNFYDFLLKKIHKFLYSLLGIVFLIFGSYFIYESIAKTIH